MAEYNFKPNTNIPNVEKYNFFTYIDSLGARNLINRFGKAFIFQQVFDKEPDDEDGSKIFPNDEDNIGRLILEFDINIVDGKETSELLILDLAFIGVSKTNNVIVTPINGRSSSIKEFMGGNDYEITINATLYNDDPDIIPRKQIIQVSELSTYTRPVRIYNTTLNDMGVYKMMITGFSMNQSNVLNLQPFTLTGLSDYFKKETL